MLTYRLNGPVLTDYETELCDLDSSILKNYITASDVHNILEHANGEDVTFNVNSGGGSVFEASEIYTLFNSYQGKVVINVTGLAASAASYMILGADEINISKSAQIMIHKPSSFTDGDSLDHKRTLNLLNSTEESIANLYTAKTGISKDKIIQMMLEETWLTADKAKELGFVDNIINDDSIVDVKNIVASYNNEMKKLKAIKDVVDKGEEMEFFEKLRNILNNYDSPEEETDGQEEKNEVEDNKSEAEEEVTPEVVETTETEEEVDEETDEEYEKVLHDAKEMIENLLKEKEALQNENEKLKKEKEAFNFVEKENKKLKKQVKNSNGVIEEIKDLVKKGKVEIIDNTSQVEYEEYFGRFGVEKRKVEK